MNTEKPTGTVFEQHLRKQAEKEFSQAAEQNLNEVKLLMSSTEGNERKAMINLGIGDHIIAVETQLGRQKQLEELKKHKFAEGGIFTGKQIKDLCILFRFYARPINMYKGDIPPDLPVILGRVFTEEQMVALNGGVSTENANRFFIAAPPDLFSDYKSIGKIISDSNEEIKERNRILREERAARMREPLLFFQPDITMDYYILLKSWGHDMTWRRKILGFFTKTRARIQAMCVSLMVLFTCLMYSTVPFVHNLIASYFRDNGHTDVEGISVLTALYFVILTIVTILMNVRFGVHVKAISKRTNTVDNWNSSKEGYRKMKVEENFI